MALPSETPVLIVGGGPVALALALDLDHMGTRCVVVERAPATGAVLLAKAVTQNERTMEFCRRWGLIDRISQCYPDDHSRDNIFITQSINGQYIGRAAVPSTNDRGTPDVGPEMLRCCAQHLFDPLLAAAVQRSDHAVIGYSHRFDSFVQDADGVSTTVTDLLTGEPVVVRSQFLIGCDGAGSRVRKQCDIPFDVISQMDFSLSIMLSIPRLDAHHPYGQVERFILIGPQGAWANLTMIDGLDMWRLTIVGSETALDPETYDPHPIVRQVLGEDVAYEVTGLVPWRRSQSLARTYRHGRVLLAGDSAHTTSPTGGHGLNTGIADATDLSWMLHAVTSGWGGEVLLDSYTRERRPVAQRNFSASTQTYRAWVADGMANIEKEDRQGDAARRNIADNLSVNLHQEWFSRGIGMGYHYEHSPVIVPDGTVEPVDHAIFYLPTARPGHRAPHAWLTDGRSVLDLFGRGFVLLVFDERLSADPLVAAADQVGMELTVEHIDQPEIAALYDRKLALVRPDGMVAWRGDELPADPGRLLDTVRGHVPAMARQVAEVAISGS